MKANVNSPGRLFGLACIAVWLTVQAWPLYVFQADSRVKFQARMGGFNLYLAATEAVIELHGSTT